MRKYELVCIFDPQVGEGKFDDLVDRYAERLASKGGEVKHTDRWGMRQLAYSSPSMGKRRQGYYVLYQFEADPAIIRSLEEDLRIDENVLRHLVVLIEGEFLRVPELVPESQIVFGPPPRERGDRGRGRDRDRGRDREGGTGGARAERAEVKTDAAVAAAEKGGDVDTSAAPVAADGNSSGE